MKLAAIILAFIMIFSAAAYAQDDVRYVGLKLGSETLTQSDIDVDLDCDADLDSPPIENLSPPQQIKVLRRLAIVLLVSKEAYKAGVQNEPMAKAKLDEIHKDVAAHAPSGASAETIKAHLDALDRFAITERFLYERFPMTGRQKEENMRKKYLNDLLKANEVKIVDVQGHAMDLPPESPAAQQ